MASPNLSELVTTTLRNRRGKLADNVSNHNSLLRRLNMRGRKQLEGGGRTLVEELEYAENATFKYYNGYETLNISPSDVFSAAEFDWKQAAVVVSISGRERRINAGKEQSIRLLERRLSNAEKTFKNQISIGIYSDGTGSSGKQIGGLQSLVADDPTTGTVGGIDRSAQTFWRNSLYDFSVEGVTASATTIQDAMNTLWLRCLRGADRPDSIVFGSTYYNFFKASLQTIQRITEERNAASGFANLTFYGAGGSAEVMYDDQVAATRGYFLNTDHIFWRVHRDADMEPLADRDSINQDAVVVPTIWMGNLTLSNAELQGVMIP